MKHQTIRVSIGSTEVVATTNGFVDFSTLSTAGNTIRLSKGRGIMNVTQYLKSNEIQTFICALTSRFGEVEGGYIRVTGRGRNAKTWLQLHVAVKVAMKMDPDFEVEVVDTFINSDVLGYRLKGGDQFKFLNAAIDAHLPGREHKPNNTGIYIQVAKRLQGKCLIEPPTKGSTAWNQAVADSVAQRRRYEMELKLCSFLEMGLVRDWDHLKELIDNM